MSNTPETDEAWEDAHPLYRLSDNEKRELCGKFEEENERLKTALRRAARWGIRSDGFSGEVSDSLRVWIDGGMVGDPPEVPSYYPLHNVEAWQPATGSAPPLQVEVCRHPPAHPRGG
jgi:hypothetical protein